MSSFNIAIIGAGPAGCTLAQILQQSSVSIKITIFEGEVNSSARTQGGTLDLHTDTGLAALKRANLINEFNKHARYDGESLKITDKHLRRYVNMGQSKEGSSRGRPEIDRPRLRDILTDCLPPGMIKWGHRLRGVDDDLTLRFDHTTYDGFDLIIGADGAWSKVRPLVSDVRPFFSGVGGIRCSISNAANKDADTYNLVNRGSVFAYGDHKSCMLQQMGDDSIIIATWSQRREGWSNELSFSTSDGDALKSYLLDELKSWDPRLQKAIELSDAKPYVQDLYMLPVRHSWTHRPGVTLMGDAAHLMTPFAGEGVNVAMTDAMRLADALIDACNSAAALNIAEDDHQAKQSILSKEVRNFETEMFSRATKVQEYTYYSMNLMFFTPHAPDSVIERWVYSHAKDHFPWFVAPLLKTAVWGYYFLFRQLGWGYS